MAGRRLPIRTLAALSVIAAIGAGQAAAAGEWVVQTNPAATTPQSGGTWQVQPTEQTWNVAPVPAAPEASEEAPTPEGILDAIVAKSNQVSLPPVPPTAVVPEVQAPVVTLDPDLPEVKALAAAVAELDRIEADLADVRTRIEGTTAEQDLADLKREEARLDEEKSAAATKVDELQARVDVLQREAEKKAEQERALQPFPFFVGPGITFSPVSGTVPTVDANLATQLDSYLAGKGSPLAGHGNTFVYQSTAVGLDPRLLVAISGAETSFGTYGPSQTIHNPFGMGPGIVYPSWDDSIASAARNLGGSLYKGAGLVTIAQIQRRWAPIGATNDPTQLNSNWYRNVSRYYAELGGDPNGTVFTDRGASQIAIPVAPGVLPGIQGTVAAPSAYGPAVKVPGGGHNTGPAALKLAQTFIGVPYLWGGTTPRGFDCSGLVQYVYAKNGVRLPRVAEQQARVGTPISPEQLAPGDAIFFADRTGYIHHEGMYIGQGLFIHAPHTGDVVKVSSLYEPFYATQYAGARRY